MSIYTETEQILARRRSDRKRLIEAKTERAMQNDAFRSAETELRKLIPLSAKAAVQKDSAEEERIQKLIDACEKKKLAALKQMKLPSDWFAVPPVCPICNDSGYFGGGVCSCYSRIMVRLLEEESDLPERKPHSFKDSDFSRFLESERPLAVELYRNMQSFSEKFPNVKKKNILFMGQSGTGKTFLVDAIYETFLSRGIVTLYSTAFSLNNLFLKYHTTFDESKNAYLDNLIHCDVLIIDDLGTEPILKNVTLEYLFSVINERKILGKSSIISTNLTLSQIIERYGERTASRIYDKNDTYLINLKFKNLRNSR